MKSIVAITFVILVLATGCGKDYYKDGGIINIEDTVSLKISTMDFLKSRPGVFDTLVTLITLTGLEDAVNASNSTFLAPKNYSFYNFFNLYYPDPEKRPKSFAEIPGEDMEVFGEMLKNYIISGSKIVRSGLNSTYSYVTTYGDKKARFNIIQEDYLGNVNMGAKYIVFSLNMAPDGSPETYQSVQVETADLQSTNGIVHVLNADTHIFGFN